MRIPVLVVVLTVIAAAGTGGWWWSQAPPPRPPLVVGVMEWPGFYPVMAADVDRAFAAAGQAVRVVAYADNPALNAALRRHEIDLACGAACDAFLMNSQGTDVVVIATLDTSDGADVVLARPGVERLGQEPGQRISFEGVNSFSHLFVLDALAQAGVDEATVRCQDLPASEVPKALLEGRLDAGHTWGPLAEQAKAQGCRVLCRAGDRPGVVTDVLMTRKAVIAERTADVHACLEVLFATVDHYRTRETELIARAATFLHKPAAELSPVTGSVVLASRAASFRHLTDRDDPRGVWQRLQAQVRELHRRGQYPDNPDPTMVIDPRFLVP